MSNEKLTTVSINAVINDANQKADLFAVFARLASELALKCPNITVSTYEIDETENQEELIIADEYFDENTILKVLSILKNMVSYEDARIILNDMQNAGILFRERRQ